MPRAFLFNPFSEYVDRVVGRFRFGLDKETKDFIEYVLTTAEKRRRQIEAGKEFWRAQLGHHEIVSIPDEDGRLGL